jgi:hypothetical protein
MAKRKRSHRRSKALVRYRTRTVTRVRRVHVKGRRRRGRRGGRSGGIRPLHLALAGAGLGFLFGAKSPVKQLPDLANKIPGSKTFGAPAVAGIACLAIDKMVKPNKWLRLAGYAGIALAALQVGQQGSDFKFVGDDDIDGLDSTDGDDDDGFVSDVGDDDD